MMSFQVLLVVMPLGPLILWLNLRRYRKLYEIECPKGMTFSEYMWNNRRYWPFTFGIPVLQFGVLIWFIIDVVAERIRMG